MRVAFINFGSPSNMKGLMINVHERAIRLQGVEKEFEVDYYLLRFKDSNLFRKFRKTPNEAFEDETTIGNVTYKNIWINRTILSYLMVHKFKLNVVNAQREFKTATIILKNYDLVMSHGYESNFLAYQNFIFNNVPYISSWHGSDINLYPHRNSKIFSLVKNIIEKASVNQFVSKKLLEKSNLISTKGNKELLYTGPSDIFYRYDVSKRNKLNEELNSNNKIIIGFVGNLIHVKNIGILPMIMNGLKDSHLFELWIIGDGNLKDVLLSDLKEKNINFRFMGRQPSSEIVKLMNCMSFLVVPSLSEGLPRVTLEAISCGVHVLGSNVGGIPEVISPKNCFELDNDLHFNIINRIQEILDKSEPPLFLDEKFKWESALNKILNNINNLKK